MIRQAATRVRHSAARGFELVVLGIYATAGIVEVLIHRHRPPRDGFRF